MSERKVTKVAKNTKQYRFVGSHADMLASGRPVEPGEFVDLTDDEVRETHNEMLIADSNLIGVEKESEHQATLAERRVERRASGAEEQNDPGEES